MKCTEDTVKAVKQYKPFISKPACFSEISICKKAQIITTVILYKSRGMWLKRGRNVRNAKDKEIVQKV